MLFLQNRYVLFALGVVAVFTAYILLVAFLRKDPMRERLRQVMPVDMPGGSLGQGARSPLAIFCSTLLEAVGVDLAKAKRDLYLPLWRAGFTSQDAVACYLVFRRFIQPLFFLAGLAVLWRLRQLMPFEPTLSVKLLHALIAVLLIAAGLFGARIYVSNRTTKRQAALQKSFPDVLDLLLICVEAGLPLDAALARVCREMRASSPDITAEMDLTRVELNVRHDRVQALKNLAERTGTQGFRILSATLIQSEQFGTSIADTLRTLADEYRNTRMLNAERKANRIPAIITIPAVVFFIIPVFIVILGPPFIIVAQQGGIFGHTQDNNNANGR